MSSGLMIVEEVSQFNASITVTELLTKTLENCAKDLAIRCIMEAAGRHGFDGNEEIRALGLENLVLIRKQMAKKSSSKVQKKEKVPKEKKTPVFPLPFVASAVDLTGCQGLAYNRGLFTQCLKKRMDNGGFCKVCQTEADKNASGCPDCGTIEARLACGLYEFKDPKGRSPVSYVKVLNKLKLSEENALEAAGKLNIDIDEEHFVCVDMVKPVNKKTKGRPKKAAAVEADNVSDLFAKLSAEDNEELIEFAESAKPSAKKAKLSDEEKAVKKAALEAERAQKKVEREAKLALEKAEREEKRKAELAQKKAEREAKIALEKAEREAKRAQEKAEREAKKAQEKAAKAEKATKGKKTAEVKPVVAKPVAEVAKPVAEVKPEEPAPTKVSVTRVQIAGKAYLKSSTNILYDPVTREEIGLWDIESKTIKELPEDDDDEEEVDDEEVEDEEYDE